MIVPRGPRSADPVVGSPAPQTVPAPSVRPAPASPIELHDLSYRFIRPDFSGPDRNQVRDAYACWREVWEPALLELDGEAAMFSDDFTRQDEIAVLFHRGAPIAMTFLRWSDLSSEAARQDSYFKAWPEPALDVLVERGTQVCICSNLTVHPAWRRMRSPCRPWHVLCGMAAKRFLQSGADVLAATTRNDVGANRITYLFGAQRVATSHLHNVEVDLVALYPEDVTMNAVRKRELHCIETLWAQEQERKHCGRQRNAS